jgi:hypothetical protein
MHLLAICLVSFDKCLLGSIVYFLIYLFVLAVEFLIYFDINPYKTSGLQYFLPTKTYYFVHSIMTAPAFVLGTALSLEIITEHSRPNKFHDRYGGSHL